MFELSASNAADYLGYPCTATLLGGGVSNTVVLVETTGGRFILKQSLGKLKVEQDWFSDRRRIFREASAMRQLKPLLPPGAVPDILFEDRANYLFAMSAAPEPCMPWKDVLLEGDIRLETAEAAARILGAMISRTRNNEAMEVEFGDQTIFHELRIDPYYRATALRHPDLALYFQQLISDSGGRRYSLVHGDWSPKNLLVSNTLMAIDFEVIHFGDPSFDAAFLLNHLLLKSFHRPEWRSGYFSAARRFWEALISSFDPEDWFESATVAHLGALLLARIDGKSPAEYIRDAGLKNEIRGYARQLIRDQPPIRSIFL